MASQISSTDRKIHLWMLSHIEGQRDTIFKSFLAYLKINLTIFVGYICVCFHIFLSYYLGNEIEKAYAFLFIIPAMAVQAILVYKLGKKRGEERDNDPEVADKSIDEINTGTISSHVYHVFFYSFAWFFIVTTIEIAIIRSINSEIENNFIEYVIFIFIPIITLAAHYVIWLSSSRKGPLLFYMLLILGLATNFFIYPGATALTRNTLRHMNIGGGIEVELYLNKPEFLSIDLAPVQRLP
jgi:hypothetical protein